MEPLKRLKLFYDIFGADVTNDSLIYSLTRDSYDRKYAGKGKNETRTPGKLKGHETKKGGVDLKFEADTLSIEFLEGKIVKVTWKSPSMDTMIREPPVDASPLKTWEEGNIVHVAKDDIEISVDQQGSIDFFYRANIIRTDEPPIFQHSGVTVHTRIRDDSKIFGLGEKALGLNLRGTKSLLWNHDANGCYNPGDDPLYLNIPFYVEMKGSLGYFVFYNNPSRATVDISSTVDNTIIMEFDEESLQYYIGFGDLKDIMDEFTDLTGKPMMPPEWALGFHQSRYSYMSEKEVLNIYKGFRKNHLPISAIHMDIDYMRGYRVFTVDDVRFPNLSGLARELRTGGVNLVTIIDPAIKMDPEFALFNDGLKKDVFIKYKDGNITYAPVWAGLSAFPDFSKVETRRWWGDNYSYLLENGISGFWHDMNEPATFTTWGDNTLPESAMLESGPHSNVHNLYGLWMAKAAYEYLTGKGIRPFILTRSGWAGIQKYAFVWTGDTNSTWAEMKSSISTMLNLGISGIPFVGVDIGGFSGNPNRELFTRWFQMGSFLPFFRVHSSKGARDREPWSYGADTLNILKKYLELRYRLLPFYYTLAYESHTSGMPMMRPVSFLDVYYPGPEETCFLVGDSILVIPILEQGTKSIQVTLPAGKWYSIWNDQEMEGLVSLNVGLEDMPVFVRGGSIIPTRERGMIELNIYMSEKCHGSLYTDDGSMQPKSKIYSFQLTNDGSSYMLTLDYQGEYKDGITEMKVRVHGYTIREILDRNVKLNRRENSFTFALVRKNVRFK